LNDIQSHATTSGLPSGNLRQLFAVFVVSTHVIVGITREVFGRMVLRFVESLISATAGAIA
ncbi:MAG TPA: hypothetical protein VIJ25_06330, partial [Methylococcales bacterium]